MSELMSLQALGSVESKHVTTAVIAILLHHLAFKRGEWHMRAPLLLAAYLIAIPVLFIAHFALVDSNTRSSGLRTGLLLLCFTVTLFGSIAVHRLCLHRLAGFPGPVFARLTKLWHMMQCMRGQNHLVLDRLRLQYGDFVRTGPNEVTIFHPDVLYELDRPGSRTTKSVWYDFLLPYMGVTTIRDKAFHDQRRRVWTEAFSTSSMEHHEKPIADNTTRLGELIQAAALKGDVVDFSCLAYWFAFDMMGSFALSRSFNMLHSGKWHYAVTNLRRAMLLIGPLSPVPWLAQIGFKYLTNFWVVKDWHVMTKWCGDQMQDRIKVENTEQKDIAHYLIDDTKKRGALSQEHDLLTGEAIVAVVAGSDTVAPTLIFLLYELARNPSVADELFSELEDLDILQPALLKNLPYLDSIIKETLRLHPAVPTGGYRDTPPHGLTIGGRWIPGDTTIVAPRYSLSRLESCFVDADQFVPDRWCRKPAMVKDDRSFLPFAQGRYTCLGKHLALAEIRAVTALLVTRYHIHFAKGEDSMRVEREMRDHFTAAPGNLKLLFEPRRGRNTSMSR